MSWLRPAWMKLARYPTLLLGLHAFRAIRAKDKVVDLHHVYGPQLYNVPILSVLKKPVVYTATAGIGENVPPTPYLQHLGAIVVPSRADLETLTARGLRNVHVIRSGIDVSGFADSPPPSGPEFVLLSGSAPWVRQHFKTKGADALLEAAQLMPELRLVFLWRGHLHAELVARVDRLGLSDRVEIFNEHVDVSEVLKKVHAAVVLADRPGLVKAYPHSLLEALASGRPVVVSEAVPMAEYVRDNDCGVVVSRVDPRDVIDSIERLRANYDVYRSGATSLASRDFSHERLINAYEAVYRGVRTDGTSTS